jgi:cephalosporin hydroxylase
VLSIGPRQTADTPVHPRLQYLVGEPHEPDTVESARAAVGGDSCILVVLGSRGGRQETSKEFEAYAPLVPVGSYVVVTDTIVNGHPVWPAFGPGPAEAVKQILTRHGEFVPDPAMEKYSLTFNPGGFLRRVR